MKRANFPKPIRALGVAGGLSLLVLCSFAQQFGGGGQFGGFPGGGPRRNADPAANGPDDPGVQQANRGTGASLVTPANDPGGYVAFFDDGLDRFQEVDAVVPNGLGPRFNSNSCSSCHSQPAVGGSGAAVNPQFQFTTNGVAPGDKTPFFITQDGPTREARFPFFFSNSGGFGGPKVNPNAPNGGVETLFTVTGRPDAGTCKLQQPDFDAAKAANNITFRIPTAVFGA